MEVDNCSVSLETTNDESKASTAKELLRNDMLDYLCKSKEAHFKSQQIGDPELLDCEKRVIAESILDRNCVTFLARFGTFLLQEHLEYFNDCSDDQRYEVDFYLKQLHASHNKAVSRVKVKNRRFEALKKLVSEGSYFSEYEMKKRNPLLYEHLVGQFLTAEEEKERTGIDTSNITFVNLLLEQYDRDQMKKLKQRQEEDEDNQREKEGIIDNGDIIRMNVDYFDEENGTDDDDISDQHKVKLKTKNQNKKRLKAFDAMYDDDDDSDYNDSQINKSLWGEEMTDKSQPPKFLSSSKEPTLKPKDEHLIKKKRVERTDSDEEEDDDDKSDLTDEERQLLMEEFRSSMFNSFLEGKDSDFDYHEVDENSDYDDIDMRDEDEQEKYFNSESPDDDCEVVNNDCNGCETKDVADPATSNHSGPADMDTLNGVANHEDKEIENYVATLHSLNTDNITNKMENLHH